MPTLLRRDNETYRDQVVYMAGHAFSGCTFENCTLVVREATGVLENCRFDNCVWHLDLFVADLERLAALINHIAPLMRDSLPSPADAPTVRAGAGRRGGTPTRPPGGATGAAATTRRADDATGGRTRTVRGR